MSGSVSYALEKKAEPFFTHECSDGHYKVSGKKIFFSLVDGKFNFLVVFQYTVCRACFIVVKHQNHEMYFLPGKK